MSISLISLLLLSFLQTTLMPFHLVMLFLICRSFTTEDNKNYILAFGFGLFVSFLAGETLGILSIVYLLTVKAVYLFKNAPFTSRWYFILPISFLLASIFAYLEGYLFKKSFVLSQVLTEMLFVLPMYIFVRFWEERFVPKTEIRLKIGR